MVSCKEQCTASTLLNWNYTRKSAVAASVPTHHQFGGPHAQALADWLEDYEPLARMFHQVAGLLRPKPLEPGAQ